MRAELERNLSDEDMRHFYQLLLRTGVTVDFAVVPLSYITAFEEKGLNIPANILLQEYELAV